MKIERQFKDTGFDDLSKSALEAPFIYHLVQIFCAKSHLSERLPELCSQPEFKDLYIPIQNTISDTENQLQKICAKFKFLEALGVMDDCGPTISMMEVAFSMIHKESYSPVTRNISTLYYLQSVLDIEARSFQILALLSNSLDSPNIKMVVAEFYNEAKKPNTLQRFLIEQSLAEGTLLNQQNSIGI